MTTHREKMIESKSDLMNLIMHRMSLVIVNQEAGRSKNKYLSRDYRGLYEYFKSTLDNLSLRETKLFIELLK